MTFEEMVELAAARKREMPIGSGTAELFAKGAHAIGKKLVEEAAESWMAARYESDDELAQELSQVLYYVACMMAERSVPLAKVYGNLIKVALPNKGQLFEPTIEILNSCGYTVSKTPKGLSSLDPENNVQFYFLRPGDIPIYVSNGVLDAGITGKDFAAEKGQEAEPLIDLNFGRSRLHAAVMADAPYQTLDEIADLRIATSYPTITRSFFAKPLKIIELEGAVEISVELGIADAVIDVVETGSTLELAGLRIVGEPLFRSNAALFGRPHAGDQPELRILRSRIEGRLVALNYMMVEYDCPGAILPEATKLTPGLESPTITPLQREGWLSVKAMINKHEANRIMDELSRLGARGILLTKIETARI